MILLQKSSCWGWRPSLGWQLEAVPPFASRSYVTVLYILSTSTYTDYNDYKIHCNEAVQRATEIQFRKVHWVFLKKKIRKHLQMYHGPGTVERIVSGQPVDTAAYVSSSRCSEYRAGTVYALNRWQHFSAWNDVM